MRHVSRDERCDAEEDERGQRRPQQVPILEPRCEHEHDERRHGDRRQRLVGDAASDPPLTT